MFRRNTELYISFSVPIKKELDNDKTITYKLKFIDSCRFMSTSLSKLADNLSDRLHKDKCKDCKSKLSYMSVKDNQLIFVFCMWKELWKRIWHGISQKVSNGISNLPGWH